MKKIGYITTISLTLKTFVLPAAKALHDTGEYDITFICNNDDEFAKSLPEYIHYIPVRMGRGVKSIGPAALNQMFRIFKEQHFDLIQYSTPNASLYASIAGAMAHVPVRLYCQWGIVYFGFEGIKRQLLKAEEKMVCRLSTWVEPDSFGNLNFARNEGLYNAGKSSVIWNGSACGINLEKFNNANHSAWRAEIRSHYNLNDDAVVFIFAGRLNRDKGVNELFAASRRLIKKYPNVYLMMVGSNENPQSVNYELVKWSEDNDYVIYTGYVDCMEKYYSAADVFILPSYREGFGLGVVEAEAMELPVIVSDIPGPVDAMKKDETGLIVKRKSAKELYFAMKRLYKDKQLREKMGEAGHRFALESFDQKVFMQKMREDRERLLR